MSKQVPLTKGMNAIVDEIDFDRVAMFRWQARWSKSGDRCYAGRTVRRTDGSRTSVQMHRFIVGAESRFDVDHINGDGLDNRRSNLRICTRSQNLANRGAKPNTKSVYKGVYWDKRCRKWFAQIRVKGRQFYLGVHATEEEAAEAYDSAAVRHFGEFARTNGVRNG